MKYSIIIGLFIGVVFSSIVLLLLKFIPLNYPFLLLILYMYAIVGGVTAFFVHKRITVEKISRVVGTMDSNNTSTRKYREEVEELRSLIRIIKSGIRIQHKLEMLREENTLLVQEAMQKLEEKIKELG